MSGETGNLSETILEERRERKESTPYTNGTLRGKGE
jgi:hypothetical protein